MQVPELVKNPSTKLEQDDKGGRLLHGTEGGIKFS